MISLICYSTHFAFGIFFKPIMFEFGWSRAMLSGAFSAAWIVTGFAGIAMGGLNDRLGPRVVIAICGTLVGAGYILMSLVQEAWQLYLFYGIIAGSGLSVSLPLMSTIARWFTKQRTLMTGILVAGTGVGALIGPPIADSLISAFGWRTSYIILGIVVLVIVIPISQLLRRDPSQIKQVKLSGKTTQPEFDSGTTGFSLQKAAFTIQFWLTFFMLFCSGYLLYAAQIHLAPHVTDVGFSTTTAAAILAVMGGTSIVGRIALGMAGDKIGNKSIFAIGLGITFFTFIWLLFSRDEWWFFLFAIIFGIAYGGCISQQSPLIANLFGLKSHGLLMGVNGFGFTIGSALGPLLTGYMFDVSGNYQLAFIICIIISILGFILTMMLKPTEYYSVKVIKY